MPPSLEPQVRALCATCHPGWDDPSPHWFFANPTLVVLDEQLVAYTSYAMNMDDAGRLAIYLQDTGVAPAARGRGLSRVLMNARLDIGRSMGARLAVGMTQPDNVPMLGLLRSCGFRELTTLPGAYTQVHPAADGVVFVLDL
jgi:GNAT superfamily N-acetyltransferase